MLPSRYFQFPLFYLPSFALLIAKAASLIVYALSFKTSHNWTWKMKTFLLIAGILFLTISAHAENPLKLAQQDCDETHFFSPGWQSVCESSAQKAFELSLKGALNMPSMILYCADSYIPSAGPSCLAGVAFYIERLRFKEASPLLEAKKDCDDSHFFSPGWQSVCERSAQKAFELSLKGQPDLLTIKSYCDTTYISSVGPSCLKGGAFYIQRFSEAAQRP